ncbi:ATP-binding protein [Nocardiopsis sp. Huas11]|uniref:ATP-binding protein n=1 Tax=Nocardiopsis sp. Huas11 TaxID=2183912 RepID=UPI001F2CA4C4|nr:ATP-binding protein [Nocardiopsis sp. Huas11]
MRVKSRRSGLSAAYFDGNPEQVRRIRTWCEQATRLDEGQAAPVVMVVNELVTNAIAHSASGGRHGRVKVVVEVLPGDFVLVAVTDDGPSARQPITVPHVAGCDGDSSVRGRGLLLVSKLSEKWWWTGYSGGPLTVWALIDPQRDPDD